MAEAWALTGGERLEGGRAEPGDLWLAEGRIAEAAPAGARRFDATGLRLAAGIVDLHGDAFERILMPRAGVALPPETALLEAERQLLANGITTAFLAMTVSWEPGLRSLGQAEALRAALAALRPRLRADLRLQIRWEIFALDAVAAIEGWLAETPAPVLAFNDHLSGLIEGGRLAAKLPELARRAGLSEPDYTALVASVAGRAGEVPGAILRLSRAAAAHGVARLAHDEASPEARRRNRGLGIPASEFPMSLATARAAREAGEPVILGAPNVLRGGSHVGGVDAAAAVAEGLCTALASDYYYPAPLAAAGRLGLAAHWPLVSEGPAAAAGLADRGRLEPGLRGDVVALAETPHGPVVEAVWVGGRAALLRDAGRLS